MAYKHHHEISITITLIALSALLITVQMNIETSITSVGIFILYWVVSSAYFKYFESRIEERIFLTVTGTIFLFIFISLLAFLSNVDLLTILLGILLSTAILFFPISHSLLPSRELRIISNMPEVKHKYFMPFSSCYRVDVENPTSLYIRDVIGSDEIEFSFYLKNAPRAEKVRQTSLIKELSVEGKRISIDVSRDNVRSHPRNVLRAVQRIAKEL